MTVAKAAGTAKQRLRHKAKASGVNSASPEPTPDQVHFLRPPFLHFSVSPLLCPLHFRLLLNILVPVP
ncbi:hypothetical protein PAXRUDRAFT_22335 [Paxillus rubicundulus Ve08.2h10]|uniref:Uncharacterized protein n=1 Tax=Paxillus rubicundulus Ve08.2h10 TaxID=930991 RepID=A0A0D0CNA6_9AGAM|nr:hypothetical protein PAXRUDRAFT_22335 [Paxillus rubicundulus Ve08.2h10]